MIMHRFALNEIMKHMTRLETLRKRRLKYVEDVIEGLENTPKAFIGLFAGENLGKQLVKVSW
jgi:NADPH-dependent curcumin reductase CurA